MTRLVLPYLSERLLCYLVEDGAPFFFFFPVAKEIFSVYLDGYLRYAARDDGQSSLPLLSPSSSLGPVFWKYV